MVILSAAKIMDQHFSENISMQGTRISFLVAQGPTKWVLASCKVEVEFKVITLV